MEKDQITPSRVVAVLVDDRDDLAFFYDCDTRTTFTEYDLAPHCTIKVSPTTFERLLQGQSTFEHEVTAGKIIISGDTQVLRDMGKIFRSS